MKKHSLIILIPSILVFLIVLNFSLVFSKKESVYKNAISFEKSGQTEKAWLLFQKISGFKDSSSHIKNLEENDFLLPFRLLPKGSVVQFGTFETDGESSNGKEKLNWIILDRIDDEVLLISEDILLSRAYNPVPFAEITWEKCDLRSYLNNDFYENAFSPKEKEVILLTENQNENQSKVGTFGGKTTFDKIFLLSENESKIYINDELSEEDIGKAYATQACKNQGIMCDEEELANWWLRSPGVYGYSAQFINQEGSLYVSGANVDIESYGVRPCLYVSTKKKA